MKKLSSILQERFHKKEKPKMSELGSKTAQGELTAFSGLFGALKNADKEKAELTDILRKYAAEETNDFSADLISLLEITSEVKAIQAQSILLHGARIKKAQNILKKYREGAFTSWLQCTYGNRQTPYNFLQYYEFYLQIPKALHEQMEQMPRQVIYTLASREGEFSKKLEIVSNYKGETKQQLVTMIRAFFPLQETDRRKENLAENAITQLERIEASFVRATLQIDTKQKKKLLGLLQHILKIINEN